MSQRVCRTPLTQHPLPCPLFLPQEPALSLVLLPLLTAALGRVPLSYVNLNFFLSPNTTYHLQEVLLVLPSRMKRQTLLACPAVPPSEPPPHLRDRISFLKTFLLLLSMHAANTAAGIHHISSAPKSPKAFVSLRAEAKSYGTHGAPRPELALTFDPSLISFPSLSF